MGAVSQKPSLERVIVIPRNGYLNRLQAWASAAILAAHYDVPIRVLWENESIAPAGAEELFAPSLVASAFIERDELDELLAQPHEDLPRYLTSIPELGVAVLAGHDMGEQAFMGDLEALIAQNSWLKTLIIIAGGKFHVNGTANFTRQREVFYRQLRWNGAIDDRVQRELSARGAFNALHLRGTDHALSSPTPHQVEAALTALRLRSDERSLFIAADTASTRELWTQASRELGFEPWSVSGISLERGSSSAGVDALIDWRLLGSSQALVYSTVSTFAEEAAVASGNVEQAIPLTASAVTQQRRKFGRLFNAGLTYPKRKFTRH